MSAFIPNRSAPRDGRYENIQPDDFFPVLGLSQWRDFYRVDDELPNERAAEILTYATLLVQGELAAWREQQAAQHLPGNLAPYYRAAVYNRAKAAVLEQYRSIDTTDTLGDKRAKAHEARIDTAMQRSREAIRYIQGKTRVMVALV